MLVGTLRAELSLDTSAFLASMKQVIANAKKFNSNIVQEVTIDSSKAEAQVDRLGILFKALKDELASVFTIKVNMDTEQVKTKGNELYKFISWLRKGTEGPPALIKVDIDTSLMKPKAQELYGLIEWLRKGAQGSPALIKVDLDTSQMKQKAEELYKFINWLRAGTQGPPAIIKVDLDTGTMKAKAQELYKFLRWLAQQTSIPYTVMVDASTTQVEYAINKLSILLNGIKEMTSTVRTVRVTLDIEGFTQQLGRFNTIYESLKNTLAMPLSARVSLEFESLKQGSENLTTLVQNLSGQVDKPITLKALLDTTQFDKAAEDLIDFIDILHDQAAKPVTLNVAMKDPAKAKGTKQSVAQDAQGFKQSAEYIKQAGQNAASATQNFTKAAAHIKTTSEGVKDTAGTAHKASVATKELGKETEKVGKTMSKSLGKEPQEEVEKTTKTIQNSTWTIRGYIKDLSRVVTGILMSQMFYTILRGIKDTIAESYALRQEFERMAISFQYLLGITNEQAKVFSSQMREWGLATEFSIMGATNAFRQLIFAGVGLENMNSAMYVITGTASALGLELEEVVGTMLQIQAATTVSTSELRRLARMGYPIGRILREQLNLTSEDLQDINELKIPGDVMFKALIVGLQDFGEAGQDAAATTRALASDITETFRDIAGLAFENVLESWRQYLERTLKIVALVRKEILSVGIVGIGKVFPPQLKQELLIMRASFLAVWDAIKILSKAFKSSLGYSIKDLLQIFSRIVPVIANVIHTFAEFMQQIIATNPHIRALVGSLVGLGVANIVVGIFKALINVMIKFGIVKVVTSLFHGLAKAFEVSWKWGVALIAIIGVGLALLMSNAKAVQGYIQGVTQSILDAFGSFSDAGKLPDQEKTLEDIYSGWENIKEGIDDATEAFKPFLAAFDEVYNIPTQAEEISNEWEKLAEALEWPEYELPEYNWEDFDLWSWIPFDSWQGSWDNFWASLKTAPRRLLDWWNTTARPAVSNWLRGVGDDVKNWFTALPGRIAQWLEEKTSLVANWFTTLPGKVKEWLEEHTPTAQDISTWFANLPNVIGDWLREKIKQAIEGFGIVVSWLFDPDNQIIENFKTIISNAFETFNVIVKWLFTEIAPGAVKEFIDSLAEEVVKWVVFINWAWKKYQDNKQKFLDEHDDKSPFKIIIDWAWKKYQDNQQKFKDEHEGKTPFQIIIGWAWRRYENNQQKFNEEFGGGPLSVIVSWVWKRYQDNKKKFDEETEGLSGTYYIIRWAWRRYQDNKKKFEEEHGDATPWSLVIDWIWKKYKEPQKKFEEELGDKPLKVAIDWAWNTYKDNKKKFTDETGYAATPIGVIQWTWKKYQDNKQKFMDENEGKTPWQIIVDWTLKKTADNKETLDAVRADLEEEFGTWGIVIGWVLAPIGDKISDLYKGIRDLVSNIPVAIEWVFSSISTKIKKLKEDIAEAFRNFIIKLNLKLPTIEYTMTKKNLGIFGEVELPKFNLRWNKEGGIYDKESIVGLAENAKEAVIPLSGKEMRPFAQAIAQELRAENNKQGTGSTNEGSSPIVYVQYLIADERGLRELERRMRVVRLEEDLRGGLA